MLWFHIDGVTKFLNWILSLTAIYSGYSQCRTHIKLVHRPPSQLQVLQRRLIQYHVEHLDISHFFLYVLAQVLSALMSDSVLWRGGMDSITLVVGGRGGLGLGLGKIRTTIPGRVQMSDKVGFQILDTFWGLTHTEKKWSEGGYHSKNPKYCWKHHFKHLSEIIMHMKGADIFRNHCLVGGFYAIIYCSL